MNSTLRLLWPLSLCAAVACGGDKSDSAGTTGTTGTTSLDVDADGDGYTVAAGDCDDGDASINPAAEERWYDGVDSDCAGDDDNDADGDGTPLDGDCNDTDASIYPGAEEVWYDGIDQDCDEGDDYDADADGYGVDDCDDTDPTINPAAAEVWYDGVDQDCAGDDDDDADGDTWPVGDDCDDADALVSPDADEICDDGVDNDCDGIVAGCGIWQDQSLANADIKLVGEGPNYRLGQGDPGAGAAGDLDGDGDTEVVVSSIFESSIANRQGAIYVLDGPVSAAGSSVADAAVAKISGDDANDWFGYAVAGVGDVDNDGYDDLFVSATRDDTAGTDAGVSYLLRGPITGDAAVTDAADLALTGAAAGDISGELTWVGDVDNDGFSDLLVGAQWNAAAGSRAGAAYLFFGSSSLSGTQSLASADAVFEGIAAGDEASSSIGGIGDTDGDGLFDFAVGAVNDDTAAADAGAVYVVLGSQVGSGTVSFSTSHAILTGEVAGSGVGYGVSVSTAGDVNNDGYDDMIVGSRWESSVASNAGAAYVVLGPVSAGTWSLSLADAKLTGETSNDQAGDSVGGPGDVDGDGFDDVVVGSGYNSLGATEGGAAYIVRGPVSGTQSLADADGILRAEAEQDRLRTRGAGDFDNDGLMDVLVTAQLGDDTPEDAAGAFYLVRGAGL